MTWSKSWHLINLCTCWRMARHDVANARSYCWDYGSSWWYQFYMHNTYYHTVWYLDKISINILHYCLTICYMGLFYIKIKIENVLYLWLCKRALFRHMFTMFTLAMYAVLADMRYASYWFCHKYRLGCSCAVMCVLIGTSNGWTLICLGIKL